MYFFKEYKYYIAIAVVFHTALLCLFLSSKISSLGSERLKQSKVMQAYFLEENFFHPATKNESHPTKHVAQPTSKIALSKHQDKMQPKSLVKHNQLEQQNKTKYQKKNKQEQVKKSVSSSAEKNNVLLAKLHDAIQAQQHYPEEALENKEEGIALVGFSLGLDGSIANLKLIKSSGNVKLDSAALSAVKRAAPFSKVTPLLKPHNHFEIKIAFKIDSEADDV